MKIVDEKGNNCISLYLKFSEKNFVWRCKTSLLLAPICLFLFFIVHLLVSKVIWNLNP